MEATAPRHFTVEEYLAFEEQSEEKHEYFQGEIFAMAGGGFNHAALQVNLAGLLHAQLRGKPCRPLSSDFRILVEASGLYTYPDLSVVCGEPRLQANVALLNPTVLFEVLSPSTEGYDRGAKAAMYRRLKSLEQYVLIAQDRLSVEIYTRQPDGRWTLEEYTTAEAAAPLASIGCTLSLAALYEGIDLTNPTLHPEIPR